jgi:hypothetical protein
MLLLTPDLLKRMYKKRSRSAILMLRKFATIRYTGHFLQTVSAFNTVLPEFSEYADKTEGLSLPDQAFR